MLVDEQAIRARFDGDGDGLYLPELETAPEERRHHIAAGGRHDANPHGRADLRCAGQAGADHDHLVEHRLRYQHLGREPANQRKLAEGREMDERTSVGDDAHARPIASPARISRSSSSSSRSKGEIRCVPSTCTNAAWGMFASSAAFA